MSKHEAIPVLNLTEIPEGHGIASSHIAGGYPVILFSETESYNTPGKLENIRREGETFLFVLKFRDKAQVMALKIAVDALVETLERGEHHE